MGSAGFLLLVLLWSSLCQEQILILRERSLSVSHVEPSAPPHDVIPSKLHTETFDVLQDSVLFMINSSCYCSNNTVVNISLKFCYPLSLPSWRHFWIQTIDLNLAIMLWGILQRWICPFEGNKRFAACCWFYKSCHFNFARPQRGFPQRDPCCADCTLQCFISIQGAAIKWFVSPLQEQTFSVIIAEIFSRVASV